MAVVERAADGAVPFVSDNGGQREIVGDDRLTYSTVTEAAEQTDRVLSNPELFKELRGWTCGNRAPVLTRLSSARGAGGRGRSARVTSR